MGPAEPSMPAESPELKERVLVQALENALAHGGEARWETVLGKMMAADPSLRSQREVTAALVQELVGEVNALSKEAIQDRLLALAPARPSAEERGPPSTRNAARPELPPLPGAETGKVVLRFAPFPSGSLHIGNLRGVFLNDVYRRLYGGKLYVVFDDTVGSAEKRPTLEAYDLIRDDLRSAGVTPDAYYYKSDRMDLYYRYLPKLLDKGAAYVCHCPAEVLRKNREEGRACEERSRPLEWHREAWEGMLAGRYAMGEAIVRMKTDMTDPNPAFRDRVLFRISDFEHPRVGTQYRVWPMLEFAFAIDDVELGITHVLRGKDLVIEDMMEEAIWSVLGMHGPSLIHWGLLRVRDAKLSKSKAYREVMDGTYDGWSDPRTWSFSALARRGIRPDALRNFVLSFGMSLADIEVPAESLYAENRRLIDPTTPRRAFVPDAQEVTVEGFPSDLPTVTLANHPTNVALGTREVGVRGGRFFLPGRDVEKNLGGEIRLKDLLNVTLVDRSHATFTSKPNRPIPRIQWVPAEGAVPVSVLLADGTRVEGTGEPSLAAVREGDLFQFERFGFVRADPQPKDGPRRFVFGHP